METPLPVSSWDKALPTLLVRNGDASPSFFGKTHSASAFGKAADRKKPVIADAGIGVISHNRFSTLESSAKTCNEGDLRSSLSPMQEHGPRGNTPMPHNIRSREGHVVQPVEGLQGQHENKANWSANKGSSRPRRRSMGSIQVKQNPRSTELGGTLFPSIIAECRARRKSDPPSFKQAEQYFHDVIERNEAPLKSLNGKVQQLTPQMKPVTAPNQPSGNSYAEFKQRQQTVKELNCPSDTAKDAQSLFHCYAKDGVLDYKNFRGIVVNILHSTGQELSGEELEKKIVVSWHEADRNYNGKVDYDEFAIWYSSWGFQQELLLSPTKIRTRDLARRYNLSIAEVDSAHTMFESFDENGSGEIEFNEFEKLLYKLIKVPEGEQLPARRVQHFWREIDRDQSGSVDFAEFLQWYHKYFDMQGISNISPMEQFYQSHVPNALRYM